MNVPDTYEAILDDEVIAFIDRTDRENAERLAARLYLTNPCLGIDACRRLALYRTNKSRIFEGKVPLEEPL